MAFSALSSLINLSYGFSLITAAFLIYFALSAYFNVLTDSSKNLAPGLIAQIIYVLELPPSAFYNILVRFEFLYGTTTPFLPFCLSTRALITSPKHERLLLIIEPSLRRSPVAPVYPAFSDPAKSIRLITDVFYAFLP